PAGLVEAELTDSIGVVADPARENASLGTLELPIRLKNLSSRPIHGPLIVKARRLEGRLLNAANGKSDSTTTMDYSRALGDFGALPPGAVSEAIVWRFATPKPKEPFPAVRLEVRGKIRP